MLATESLQLVKNVGGKASKEDKKYLKNFDEFTKLAEIYQAYNLINRYVEEAYRQMVRDNLYYESVFNASRFLVNNLGTRQPNGINKVYVY